MVAAHNAVIAVSPAQMCASGRREARPAPVIAAQDRLNALLGCAASAACSSQHSTQAIRVEKHDKVASGHSASSVRPALSAREVRTSPCLITCHWVRQSRSALRWAAGGAPARVQVGRFVKTKRVSKRFWFCWCAWCDFFVNSPTWRSSRALQQPSLVSTDGLPTAACRAAHALQQQNAAD